MLTCIPRLLPPEEVRAMRALLDAADWADGRLTAGAQSAEVKSNEQLPESAPCHGEVQARVLRALGASSMFMSVALPRRILPPMFNRYRSAGAFGAHVDNAIRVIPGTGETMRADLSCTLFLADPEEYEGGELIIEDHYGAQSVKLPAGDMAVYPSTSLHQVTPVTGGARVASFFWVQSMVRTDANRTLLFDLDQSVQTLAAERGANDPVCLRLTGVYHNMIRAFAEI